jgi:hypothetical protein
VIGFNDDVSTHFTFPRESATMAIQSGSQPSQELFSPGVVVLTIYGVGVIVSEKDGFFTVRLWRIPGRSIGSSSIAVLKSTCVSEDECEGLHRLADFYSFPYLLFPIADTDASCRAWNGH